MPEDRLPQTRLDIFLLTAFGLMTAVAAVNILAVHRAHPGIAGMLYAGLVVAVAWLCVRPSSGRLRRALSASWWWLLGLLVLLATVDQHHFRATEHSPHPLTSSFALELPGRLLVHGQDPYLAVLPDNAPISPGPGWIALWTPLTVPGLTACMAALTLALTGLVMRQFHAAAAGFMVLMMILQPIFESQAANGQDLYVVSLSIVILAVALDRFSQRTNAIALLAAAAGIVATARVPMIGILCVLGLGLWRKNKHSGYVFAATMLTVATLLHLAFALWSRHNGHSYPPLHVLARASDGAGMGIRVLELALVSCAAIWILIRMDSKVESWLIGMWLLMSALFIPEAIKEFASAHFNLGWEGGHYMTFALPLLIAAIALRSWPRRERLSTLSS